MNVPPAPAPAAVVVNGRQCTGEPAVPPASTPASSSAADLIVALMASTGVTAEQVIAAAKHTTISGAGGAPGPTGHPATGAPALTVADFYTTVIVPRVMAARGDEQRGGGTFRTWSSYWRLLVEGYPYQRQGVRTRDGRIVGGDPVGADERLYDGCGHKLITDLTSSDIAEAVRWSVIRASLNSHWRTARREDAGRRPTPSNQDGARRNALGAYRYLTRMATQEQLLPAGYDPCAGIYKPPKVSGARRSFTRSEHEALWNTVISGGDDPELDGLLVETVEVTGARRDGLIRLNVRDLNEVRASLWLHEKRNRSDEQPATADLISRLAAFAASRNSTAPSDPVFNFADAIATGRPHRITSRRFDTLHRRTQRTLPWADNLGVSIHWWRHHAITQVERVAGYAVAARFARHTPRTVTHEYSEASMTEVCRAVSIITGTQHPLSDGGW